MKIVLIGASNNPEKYGNKIMKDLLNKGHTVIPVNPKEKLIEGVKSHINLGFIKVDYDIVNFVVPPEVTLQILEKYKDKIINKKVWCQPGASNDEVKTFLETNGFKDYITDSCIMIEDIKNIS
ncbi:MAG: CoA-binding protein [Candidatus Gracilibacteria bacterium]|nr:CoA-binding protein [Candidatus Gracilibacteria bacterium]